ncbi:MAG: hypothetical protein GY754_39185 [bacterium]|nr:hypothetical protein [bacterium]
MGKTNIQRTIKKAGIAAVVLAAAVSLSCKNSEFHTSATIDNIPEKHITKDKVLLNGKDAAQIAISELEKKGIKKITVCRVHWIAAPLGGYLIDVIGELKKNNNRYSSFRIGIRDGSEKKDGLVKIAEQFAFIAKGQDKNFKTVWIPEGGPFDKKEIRVEEGSDFEFYFHKKEEFDSLLIDFE